MVRSYVELFEKALLKVRLIRNPQAEKLELKDFGWEQARLHDFMSFAGDGYKEYNNLVVKIQSITHMLLFEVIFVSSQVNCTDFRHKMHTFLPNQ